MSQDTLTDEQCAGCGVGLYRWELDDVGACDDQRYYCLGCILNRRCGCHDRHRVGYGT